MPTGVPYREAVARFAVWMLSPGFTGFSRIAHLMWCLGNLLLYLAFLPLLAWFGYCCWVHDVLLAMETGFSVVLCVNMAGATLVSASNMMTTESIIAKREGRDLDF